MASDCEIDDWITPISQLTPRLYLGDRDNADDWDKLQALNITYIVNCAFDVGQPAFLKFFKIPHTVTTCSLKKPSPLPGTAPTTSIKLSEIESFESYFCENAEPRLHYYRCELRDVVGEDINDSFARVFAFLDIAIRPSQVDSSTYPDTASILQNAIPASPTLITSIPLATEKKDPLTLSSSSLSPLLSTSLPKPSIVDLITNSGKNILSGNVLVHCAAGLSRSPTMCIAYLQHHFRWDLRKAFQHVKKVRPEICPNSGFLRQLIVWEKKRCGFNTMKFENYEIVPLPEDNDSSIDDSTTTAKDKIFDKEKKDIKTISEEKRDDQDKKM